MTIGLAGALGFGIVGVFAALYANWKIVKLEEELKRQNDLLNNDIGRLDAHRERINDLSDREDRLFHILEKVTACIEVMSMDIGDVKNGGELSEDIVVSSNNVETEE